jgi:hypothetical protein
MLCSSYQRLKGGELKEVFVGNYNDGSSKCMVLVLLVAFLMSSHHSNGGCCGPNFDRLAARTTHFEPNGRIGAGSRRQRSFETFC